MATMNPTRSLHVRFLANGKVSICFYLYGKRRKFIEEFNPQDFKLQEARLMEQIGNYNNPAREIAPVFNSKPSSPSERQEQFLQLLQIMLDTINYAILR